jgi:hypothetical protein
MVRRIPRRIPKRICIAIFSTDFVSWDFRGAPTTIYSTQTATSKGSAHIPLRDPFIASICGLELVDWDLCHTNRRLTQKLFGILQILSRVVFFTADLTYVSRKTVDDGNGFLLLIMPF